MWFHLPLQSRQRIAMLNLVALLLQIPDCLFHACVFWEYLEIQIWPGMVLTNLPLVGQLTMQLAAAYLQARAENRVRLAQPDRFAPKLGTYLSRAYREWAALHSAGSRLHGRCWLDDVCCGNNSFVHFVRLQLRHLKAKQKEYQEQYGRQVTSLTGIDSRVFTRGRSMKIAPDQAYQISGFRSREAADDASMEPKSPTR